ncbi:MAG: hypothetical protein K2N70_05895 [Helicobacter sp.]|nr:hypothetical protein [Helicobacter sp.]
MCATLVYVNSPQRFVYVMPCGLEHRRCALWLGRSHDEQWRIKRLWRNPKRGAVLRFAYMRALFIGDFLPVDCFASLAMTDSRF